MRLPDGSRFVELAISLAEDFLVQAGHRVGARHIANRAVQTRFIVTTDAAFNETNRIIYRRWDARPDALGFERDRG